MSGQLWECPGRAYASAQAPVQPCSARELPQNEHVVVIDARLAGTPSATSVAAAVAQAPRAKRGATFRTIAFTPSEDGLDDVARLAAELAGFGTVVGVGGGSLLDLVKLATAGGPHIVDYLRFHGQRSGLVLLPATLGPTPPRRVLVPTTVGTSSEIGEKAACVVIDGARRLVMGPALPPQVAVLDPGRDGAAHELLVEGVFEALMRVVGPYAGTPSVDPVIDRIAEATGKALVDVGNQMAANGAAVTDTLRLQAARLSAYTQIGWVMLGREPYGAKVWYFANELAWVASVRKITATACLLPAVWRRMLTGDTRFGEGRRLAALWARLVGDGDPVHCVEELLRRWDIGRTVALGGRASTL